MSHISLDLERQKKAKEYGRIKHRLFLAGLLLAGIFALIWLTFGWARLGAGSSYLRVPFCSRRRYSGWDQI